jgi:signal transduction histidine kinase
MACRPPGLDTDRRKRGHVVHRIAVAQWAHDIRNTLGTVALYLESLERPSEPNRARAVTRSNALLKKAADMCSDLMREAAQTGTGAQRREFDVMQTIGEVFDLLAPIVPASTTLSVAARGPVHVMADPQDLFRILFNLIHNAVGVARSAGAMRRIDLSLEQSGTTVTIRIADDGPGLPEHVKARLFQRDRSAGGSNGYGLSIARELAERNGAMLQLSSHARGTEFTIELQGPAPNVVRQLTTARAKSRRECALPRVA